jgi:zinc transport system substrate-binding protein
MKRFLAVALVALLPLASCRKSPDPWKEVPGGPTRVLVSIPPLYCFAKSIAGDDAAVQSLLVSEGPHDHEATPTDILKAAQAHVLFYIGLELDESFAEKIMKSSGNTKLKAVDLGTALPKNLLLAADSEHGESHHEDTHHHHGDIDPHIWLGIEQADKIVDCMCAELARIDPAHKGGFARRAEAYKKELAQLKEHGERVLAGKKNRKLVTTHDSLRYFGKSFGLEILDSIQPRPGIEADAHMMAKLAQLCKEQDVRVIALEPQYPTRSAESLQREIQAKGREVALVEVDPMETAPPQELTPAYYVQRMRANLDNLAQKLP